VISRVLEEKGRTFEIPSVLRWLLRFRIIRNIPARFIGYGIRRERVKKY